MADFIVPTLDDLAALIAALPPAARDACMAEDVHDGEDGPLTGHRLTVPDEWAGQAQALAGDLTALRCSALIAYAADLRWQREVGGITVGGVPVATDDRSKLMIAGARIAASADPDWVTLWDGEHAVDAATMIAISDAVQAHVNAVFSTFASVKAAILAGEITTRDQVKSAMAE
jgi:hypothetical protein